LRDARHRLRTATAARSIGGEEDAEKAANVTDKLFDKVEEQVENVQGVFGKIANA
jgi:hypothetical protein